LTKPQTGIVAIRRTPNSKDGDPKTSAWGSPMDERMDLGADICAGGYRAATNCEIIPGGGNEGSLRIKVDPTVSKLIHDGDGTLNP